jgi:hypothetical protein
MLTLQALVQLVADISTSSWEYFSTCMNMQRSTSLYDQTLEEIIELGCNLFDACLVVWS